ncbi:hypothetical protein [Streptomyces sp. NBC_00344]|uniref:hypothetical protein n=1 Tax=Streptomyces sp. NBC_00344 TaxID=2975720 RepID=UPI002E23EB41
MAHPRTGRILLTAALLTSIAVVPAAAATERPTAPHAAAAAVSGTPEVAYHHVADFYGSYIDAIYDGDSNNLSRTLRTFYLTPQLRKRLAAWESKNHADGVLRAQNVPTGWRVTAGNSGAGHTWSEVRLTWGSPSHPSYTYLAIQSDLATRKISDIKAGRNR